MKLLDTAMAIGRCIDRLTGHAPPREHYPPLDRWLDKPRVDAPTAARLLQPVPYSPDPAVAERAEWVGPLPPRRKRVNVVKPPTGWAYTPPSTDELPDLSLEAQPHEPIEMGGPRQFSAKDATALLEADITERLGPAELRQKWCTYHGGWADPLGGVEIRSHDGEAAGCTWCCPSCLARHKVVGRLEQL